MNSQEHAGKDQIEMNEENFDEVHEIDIRERSKRHGSSEDL